MTTKVEPTGARVSRDGVPIGTIERLPTGEYRVTVEGLPSTTAATFLGAVAIAEGLPPVTAEVMRSSVIGWLSCLDQLTASGGCNSCFQTVREDAARATGILAQTVLDLPERPTSDDAGARWAKSHRSEIDRLRAAVAKD